jgi:hypothetical protein
MNNKGEPSAHYAEGWVMGDLFEPYHLQHAVPRVLYETCNLTMKKYKK